MVEHDANRAPDGLGATPARGPFPIGAEALGAFGAVPLMAESLGMLARRIGSFRELGYPTKEPGEMVPLPVTEEGFRKFKPASQENRRDISPVILPPLWVMVVTSIRDIGGDDQVGRHIQFGDKTVYMKGVVEALYNAPPELGLKLVGVVVDDCPEELPKKAPGYSLLPTGGADWIVSEKESPDAFSGLKDLTCSVPSDFRRLPRKDLSGRALGKLRFETKLRELAEEVGADIILSDHCLLKFENLPTPGWMPARVLNIHPGITWSGDPNAVRGLTPTRDTLQRAQQPGGHKKCGASLHFVNDAFDDGPVVCDAERTEVRPDDSPETLRVRNYERSKIPVVLKGLQHYRELLAEGRFK